jgi:hypothetical protein
MNVLNLIWGKFGCFLDENENVHPRVDSGGQESIGKGF